MVSDDDEQSTADPKAAGPIRAEPDILEGAAWRFASCASGAVLSPVDTDDLKWAEAVVPGTVAASLTLNGKAWDGVDIDGVDWWYDVRFAAEKGQSAELVLDGLAVLAEIWLNDRLVGSTADMFLADAVHIDPLEENNRLAIRFRSLSAESFPRRPRARWRVPRLASPDLRWARASLFGRLKGAVPVPPVVGPWRGVRLIPSTGLRIASRRLVATVGDGQRGRVDVMARLRGHTYPAEAAEGILRVGGREVRVAAESVSEGEWKVEASLTLDDIEIWWPHGLGEQPLYDVELQFAGQVHVLGRIGFRSVAVDRSNDGFRFVVNGVPTFIGGSCWMPVDPVGLSDDRDRLRSILDTVVAGNQRMLRVSGDTVYESDTFYNLCDELGVMVWQDCMLAFSDPPADPQWEELFLRETRQNLERLSGHPSIAIISGGSEIAQQATYAGVALESGLPLLTERLPTVVRECLGDIPFVPTSPWGGDIPTRPDTGVSHYYGVGAYLRPLEDARLARPRFAAECLAFAIPPSRDLVDREFGGSAAAGHDPRWKRAVFRDAGASWDFEDVRDHYVREFFGVDSLSVRYSDPDRYLDLGRAVVAQLVERTFSEWRRRNSTSGGGLVFYLKDSLPGAGMGLLDSDGQPKDAWYAMRRALAPIALSISDEGLNGLVAHVHNDTPAPLDATLRVDLFVDGELKVDTAERPVSLTPRSSEEVGIDALFDGFRDLSWAHRFGPLTYDVVAVSLVDTNGVVLADTAHLPGGLNRPLERTLGLSVDAVTVDGEDSSVELTSRRFAQFVTLDVPGWRAVDSGFGVAPGQSKTVLFKRIRKDARFAGTVFIVNGGSLPLRRAAT